MKKSVFSLMAMAILSQSFAAELYVSPTGTGDCSSSNPCDIETALNTASSNGDNDTIYLKAGTYSVVNLEYAPTSQEGSLTIVGETDNETVLDAGEDGRVLSIDTTQSGNDQNVVITVKNLTFTNGYISEPDEKGAGLKITAEEAHVNIEKCKFVNNKITGSGDGGGLFVRSEYGSITVKNCLFDNDQVDDYSGGADLSTKEGNIVLSHSIFKNNSAGYGGGASLSVEAEFDIRVINNVFINNRALATGNGRGGGLLIETSAGQAYVVNNTFTGNYSSAYGGGLHIKGFDDNGDIFLYNNIIYGNTSDNLGNDVYIEAEEGSTSYYPSIDIKSNNYSDLYIEHDNDFPEGKLIKKYNITDHEPDFVSDGDFHLKRNSYLIDKGSDSPPFLPDKDIDGEARIIANHVDIGADEVSNPELPPDNQQGNNNGSSNGSSNNSSSSGSSGGGGGCSFSPATSPINALLYLAMPFILLSRRFFRG